MPQGLFERRPHHYVAVMSKTVRQLRDEARDYRILAETFEGASMVQALLDTAMALERLADDEEATPDLARLV